MTIDIKQYYVMLSMNDVIDEWKSEEEKTTKCETGILF